MLGIEKRSLFQRIESLRDEIPEDEQKEMVETIIDVMREHQLSFDQAHKVLDLAAATLRTISAELLL